MNLGPSELVIVLLVVLLLFGAKKLPNLARSLGSSAKEFRKGIEEGMDGEDEDTSEASEHGAPPPSSDS